MLKAQLFPRQSFDTRTLLFFRYRYRNHLTSTTPNHSLCKVTSWLVTYEDQSIHYQRSLGWVCLRWSLLSPNLLDYVCTPAGENKEDWISGNDGNRCHGSVINPQITPRTTVAKLGNSSDNFVCRKPRHLRESWVQTKQSWRPGGTPHCRYLHVKFRKDRRERQEGRDASRWKGREGKGQTSRETGTVYKGMIRGTTGK